jgi:hypothetical protein
MQTAILRKKFTKKLADLNPLVEPKQRARIAVAIDINAKSVDRYMAGSIADLEVAEKIIVQAEKILGKDSTAVRP